MVTIVNSRSTFVDVIYVFEKEGRLQGYVYIEGMPCVRMANPTAVHIRKDTLQWADSLVESGRFRSFSDCLDFAMGLYLDTITRDGVKSIPKIVRKDTVRKTVRMNPTVFDGLMATGFFERAELADYALDFYRKWLSTRDG